MNEWMLGLTTGVGIGMIGTNEYGLYKTSLLLLCLGTFLIFDIIINKAIGKEKAK